MSKYLLIFTIAITCLKADLCANDLFESAIYYYFNDEPEMALEKLDELQKMNTNNDSVVYEYRARIYWQIIKRNAKITATQQTENLEINSSLEEKFISSINRAIEISRNRYQNTESPEFCYNLIMALSTKAGFVAQMHGKKGAIEAAILMDEAVEKINICKNYYCLAYLPLGITQYFVTKEVGGHTSRRLGYWLFKEKIPNLYKTIKYDKDEAILFVETASRCPGPNFRKTEALFTLQEFFMNRENNSKKRRAYDLKALPILKELAEKYPNNQKISDNLFLVSRNLNIQGR